MIRLKDKDYREVEKSSVPPEMEKNSREERNGSFTLQWVHFRVLDNIQVEKKHKFYTHYLSAYELLRKIKVVRYDPHL